MDEKQKVNDSNRLRSTGSIVAYTCAVVLMVAAWINIWLDNPLGTAEELSLTGATLAVVLTIVGRGLRSGFGRFELLEIGILFFVLFALVVVIHAI